MLDANSERMNKEFSSWPRTETFSLAAISPLRIKRSFFVLSIQRNSGVDTFVAGIKHKVLQ